MAFLFVLALLLDSACTTACIPAELEAPAEHCASGKRDAEPSEHGCDLHGHLKPVVKDRNHFASLTVDEAPASVEAPSIRRDLQSLYGEAVRDVDLCLPPLPRRSSVLRI